MNDQHAEQESGAAPEASGVPRVSIEVAQQELIEAFSLFDDWSQRYQYLIDLGRTLPPFPAEWRCVACKLHGCQSQVWFKGETRDGRLHFQAMSDSAIVSGLINVLLRVYSGRTPREILDTPPDFIAAIGLDKHLSATRNNGLHALLKAIRSHASHAASAAGA
jgi:cysteine desulfuration protein SufE